MQKKQLNIAPLSAGFVLTAMMGFIISSVYVYPRSVTWGFTFVLFFILMFVSSLISMTYAPSEPQLATGKKIIR